MGIIEWGTAFFTAFAAVAAWKSAAVSANQSKNQSKQFEKQQEESKKISRPRLVPVNTDINARVMRIFDDWDASNKYEESDTISYDQFFSSFPIKIVNMGNSFAVNVAYHYELKGGMDAIDKYEYKGKKVEFENLSKQQLDPAPAVFNIKFSQRKFPPNDSEVDVITLRVHKIVRSISFIKGLEQSSLLLPAYFVVLNNVFFRSRSKDPDEKPFKKPVLLIKISYEDQYSNKYIDVYEVVVPDEPMYKGGIHRELIYAQISFKFIKTEPLE